MPSKHTWNFSTAWHDRLTAKELGVPQRSGHLTPHKLVSCFFFLIVFWKFGWDPNGPYFLFKIRNTCVTVSQRAPDKKSHSKFITIEYLTKHHVKCASVHVRLRCACKTMVHEEAINCEIVWKKKIEIIFCFLQSNLIKMQWKVVFKSF